jgi:hypothetical protein
MLPLKACLHILADCMLFSICFVGNFVLWSRSQAAPTAAENLQFDALVKGKDVTNMKPSRPETDGWPQIPISLVNQFGKSVSSEEKQTKR